MADSFVLDEADNPHPRMLAGALGARREAREHPLSGPSPRAFWRGYLAAMADATGCTPTDIEAWMDSHAVPGDRVRSDGA